MRTGILFLLLLSLNIKTQDIDQITTHGFTDGDNTFSNFNNIPDDVQEIILNYTRLEPSEDPVLKIRNRKNNKMFAWCPQKELLAVAQPLKSTVKIFSFAQGKPKKLRQIRVAPLWSGRITDLSIDGQGTIYCSLIYDDNLLSWIVACSPETGKPQIVVNQIEPIYRIAVSQNGQKIAFSDITHVIVKNISSDEPTHAFAISSPVTALKFFADDTKLLKVNVHGYRVHDLQDDTTSNLMAYRHSDWFDILYPDSKLTVPLSLPKLEGAITICLKKNYVEDKLSCLNVQQRKCLFALTLADAAVKDRHNRRTNREGKRYSKKYESPMPVDMDLFAKYNPAFKNINFHKEFTSFDPLLRYYLINRFNIVRK